jgi:hypothetical protein
MTNPSMPLGSHQQEQSPEQKIAEYREQYRKIQPQLEQQRRLLGRQEFVSEQQQAATKISLGQIQQQKTAIETFESNVAKSYPEQALPQYIDRYYNQARAELAPKIEGLRLQIENAKKALQDEYTNAANRNRSVSDSFIRSKEDQIESLQARLGEYEGAYNSDKISLIKKYFSGETEARANYAQDRTEQRQAYREQQREYRLKNPPLSNQQLFEQITKQDPSLKAGEIIDILRKLRPEEFQTPAGAKPQLEFSYSPKGELQYQKIAQPTDPSFSVASKGSEIIYGDFSNILKNVPSYTPPITSPITQVQPIKTLGNYTSGVILKEFKPLEEPKTNIDKIERFLEQQRNELEINTLTGKKSSFQTQILGGLIGGFGYGAIKDIKFYSKAATQNPITTAKELIGGFIELGKKALTTGFPEVSQTLIENPSFAIGYGFEQYLGAKAATKAGKVATNKFIQGITAVSPKYAPVLKTLIGEEFISGQKLNLALREKDILLIPEGRLPKLEPNLRQIEKFDIPFKETPKLPELTAIQKDIVNIAQQRGDILSGSFAQQVLLREGYARAFKDIDILSKDAALTADVIRNTFPELNVEKTLITDSPLGKFEIYRVKNKAGEVIADIDPLAVAEEGFAKKYPAIEAQGYKFLNPKARLIAKTLQIARKKLGSENKVVTDIEGLTSKQIDIDIERASFRGAFGYSKEELASYIGKTGDVVTSARDLFGLIFNREKTISDEFSPYGIFATPLDIKTGLPMTRISRLGLEPSTASILDILSGDISFRKQKPQIVLFKDIKIGEDFIVPFKSSELEVSLPPGYVIKRARTQGVTILRGKRVPIIEAEIIKETPKITELKKQLLESPASPKILKAIDKELGLEVSSAFNRKPYFSLKKLGAETSLRLRQQQPRAPSIPQYTKVLDKRAISKQFIPSYSKIKAITYKNQSYIEPSYKEPKYIQQITPRYSTPSRITPSYQYKPRYSQPSLISPPYFIPKKPFLPVPKSEEEKRKRKLKALMTYRLLVKRRGKYKAIRTGLTRAKALRMGSDIALNTLARSFKLEKENKYITAESEPEGFINKNLFRGYRIKQKQRIPLIDTYIQKTNSLLKSLGEKQEIKASRRRKLRF